MRLQFVKLLREVHSPEFPEVPERMETPGRERFTASDELTLEREGDTVTITGKYGAILVPWSRVEYARPETTTTQEPLLKVAAVAGKATRGGK